MVLCPPRPKFYDWPHNIHVKMMRGVGLGFVKILENGGAWFEA